MKFTSCNPKFNTHELDQTGLSYFNARYYDSDTGRFISPDPTVPDPTSTQHYNRYMFVTGNPISLMDASGYSGNSGGNSDLPKHIQDLESENDEDYGEASVPDNVDLDHFNNGGSYDSDGYPSGWRDVTYDEKGRPTEEVISYDGPLVEALDAPAGTKTFGGYFGVTKTTEYFDSPESISSNQSTPNTQSSSNSSTISNVVRGGMTGSNTLVGATSTYIAEKGKFHLMNEIWHKTKTKGFRFRWQKAWNIGRAPAYRQAQINMVAGARNLSNKITKVSGLLLVADIGLSGEIKPSHGINAAMLLVSTTGVGAIVAGVWFITDFGVLGYNYFVFGEVKSLSDIIDNKIGTFEMYEGLY
jgi:RHS repeat-associated protein